jgi:hypothetical protein
MSPKFFIKPAIASSLIINLKHFDKEQHVLYPPKVYKQQVTRSLSDNNFHVNPLKGGVITESGVWRA